MTDDTAAPLKAHDLQRRIFIKPTWCSMCKGIMVGSGFECKGACGRRCHLGLGANNAENCKADLLLEPCFAHEDRAQGGYHFGDITRQLFRDAHQNVKDVVVDAIVKEQRDFGKFDKLKQYSDDIQEWWNEDRGKQRIVCVQILSLFAAFALTWIGTVAITLPMHGVSKAYTLAWIQSWSNVTHLAVTEGVLLAAVHLGSHQLLLHAEIVYTFFHEILQIDLGELDIKLAPAAVSLTRVTFFSMKVAVALATLSFSVWLRAMQSAY